MPDNDQLAVLRRLRNEGRISDEEYEDLTKGLHSPADIPADIPAEHAPVDADEAVETEAEDTAPADVAPEASDPLPPAGGPPEQSEPIPPPRLRQDLSANYLTVLALTAVALLVVSSLGMLSWLVSITAILVLATTLVEGWGRVTFAGAVAVAGLLVVSLVFSATASPQPEEAVATGTLPPQDPYPPIPGSLGIYMDQVTGLWNAVDAPPRITKGLTRYNETGEYDTFIYRFGEWGRVAGAYDPANDALYALLVTGQFSGESTEQLYLHACYLVAPYSQECIDSYHEVGLDGGSLDDFVDLEHEAEWTVGEHAWRLEIAGNVLTIRVYGADAV